MNKEDKNPEHLNSIWKNQNNNHVMRYTAASVYGRFGGDSEYTNLYNEHYKGFSGKILEIGAGTGFLAKHILSTNSSIDYTVLDIKKNIPVVQETLKSFSNVNYIPSSEYKKIFEEEYDLFIATHCLSETPIYYHTEILNKIKAGSCFIIDYGGPDLPDFDKLLHDWASQFPTLQVFKNQDLLGAKKNKGIPVFIGK